MSKKSISIVILVAIISLIGIITVQVDWLTKSIETNRQIFNQKLDLATEQATDLFRENNNLAENLDLIFKHQSEYLSVEEFDEKLKMLIDSALNSNKIPVEYEYGVYGHIEEEAGGGFQFISGNTTLDLSVETCLKTKDINFGWSSLTCAKGYGKENSYHLGVYYPDTTSYILFTIKGSLITSVVFILLLVACFFYTIITIKNQKKLSEMKNDFINNLTHEFKTPIFSIDLASGILKKSPELNQSEKLMKVVEVIDGESKRLKRQVDKVLQMALVDNTNFKLEKKDLDIHKLIKKAAKSFELIIKERGGQLNLDLKAKNITLFGDETHLNNIIYNLLDNAQKYTNGPPEITIATADGNDGLKLNIKDNGIGICQNTQRYIFDKFYRAESGNIHNVKGFGLGLSYVKKVVEAHKGWINLESAPNSGSQFTLHLPLS